MPDDSQGLNAEFAFREPLPKPEAKDLVSGSKKNLTEAEKDLAKLKADHAKEPNGHIMRPATGCTLIVGFAFSVS